MTRAAVLAGIAAGVTSTAAQLLLWIALTDAFPAILWRDTRYAAAIVLGPGALAATYDSAVVWVAATLVHFTLSIAYAWLLGVATRRLAMDGALLAGAAFGMVLYAVNMHALTLVYPWFANARDAITFTAHVVFGVTAAYVFARACVSRPS